MTEEQVSSIALSLCTRPVLRQKCQLVKECGSATEACRHPSVREMASSFMARAEEEMAWVEKNRIRCICLTNDDYPTRLKQCVDAPVVLFALGNVNLNPTRVLAVVGTRLITEYGRKMCDVFIRELAQKSPDTLIFVDPAMADNGKLYPAFGPEFPKEMAKVCAKADIVVPNLTEACLLTDTPYKSQFTEDEVKELLRKLCALGAKKAVLTGVGFTPKELGVMAYDPEKDEYFTYIVDHLPQHYHGTGDLFASCCIGAMMDGCSLEDALKVAVDFIIECIRLTVASGKEKYYGVEFERAFPFLLQRLGKV